MRLNQRCVTKNGEKVTNGRIIDISSEGIISVCSDCFNIMEFTEENFYTFYILADDFVDIPVRYFMREIKENMARVEKYLDDKLEEEIIDEAT